MLSCRVSITEYRLAFRNMLSGGAGESLVNIVLRFMFFTLSFGERMNREGRVRQTHRGSFPTCVSDSYVMQGDAIVSVCSTGRFSSTPLIPHASLLQLIQRKEGRS